MRRMYVKQNNNQKQSFFQGALILTLGMTVVKLIGALFKIPLSAAIGEYGMGLFSVAYNFYGPIHSFTIAGLPIAISRMVAESHSKARYLEIRRIKSVAFPIVLALAITGSLIMAIGTPLYCKHVIGNPHAVYPMLALTPAVFFGCLCSIYRGYNEGLKNMIPTALSEIIEALSKLIFGLSGAVWLLRKLTDEYTAYHTLFGTPAANADDAQLFIISYAAAAAVAGVSLGSILSFLFLWIRAKLRGDGLSDAMLASSPPPQKRSRIVRRLVKTAIPIAIGSFALNISGLIDTTFLQSRLQVLVESDFNLLTAQYSGLIPEEYLRNPSFVPNFLFGCYTLAMTVYMLVPTITQAFSISALPNITSVWASHNRNALSTSIQGVLKLTCLISIPAGIGISALAQPISFLLYGAQPASQIIADCLFLLGFASSLVSISTLLSSMLQAVGRADLPVKMLLIGMVIKIISNYLLCSIPEINLYGAAAGTFFCYLFLLISQWLLLKKISKTKLNAIQILGKPVFSGILCGAAAYIASDAIQYFASSHAILLGTVGGVLAGLLVYILALVLTGGISSSDLKNYFKSEKIAKLLEKYD